MASLSQPQQLNHNNCSTTTSVRDQDSSISADQDCNISSSNNSDSSQRFFCGTATNIATSSNNTNNNSSSESSVLQQVTTNTSGDFNNQSTSNNFSSLTQDGHRHNMFTTSSVNSGGNNSTSESSISSSTNPTFSSIAGAAGTVVETEFEGSGDLGTNYRASCVTEDDAGDAGSSSHSEVRSPGLAEEVDADVEDSPSSEQETGSESERSGDRSASNMYAPNTVGFPPSRSAVLTHTIPTGANFVTTARFVPGSNPFAVKAGSISSSSGSNSVSNVDYCSSSNISNNRSNTNANSLVGNSLSRGNVASGRWGPCQPQKPPSWNSRPIIRPSSLGSSLGSGVTSSAGSPPASSGINSGSFSSTSSHLHNSSSNSGHHSSTPNYFTMAANATAAVSEITHTGSSSSSFVLRPPKLPFGLVTSTTSSTTSRMSSSPFSNESSYFSTATTSSNVKERGSIVSEADSGLAEESRVDIKTSNRSNNECDTSSTTPNSNSNQQQQQQNEGSTSAAKPCVFVPLEKEEMNNTFDHSIMPNTSSQLHHTTSNIFSSINGTNSFASIGQSASSVNNMTTTSTSSSSISESSTGTNAVPVKSSSAADSSAGSFVFGSNLQERIANPSAPPGKDEHQPSTNGISSATATTADGTSSSSDGLFCAALRNVQGSSSSSPLKMTGASSSGETYSSNNQLSNLSGVPSAFCDSESHADRKRRFDEGPAPVTGEEDESNVIQISCRLFAFDSVTSAWTERGRGVLRVNDRAESNNYLQSRVIVRTKGSLRLMLNTNVWSDMKVDRTSEKSVRFTANDNGHIRLFLVMATVNEAEQVFNALDWRVRNLKSLEEQAGGSIPSSSNNSSCRDGDEPSYKLSKVENVDGMKRLVVKRPSNGDLKGSTSDEEDDENGVRVQERGFNNDGDESFDDDVEDDDDDINDSPSKRKRFVDPSISSSSAAVSTEPNNLSSGETNLMPRKTPTIRINNLEMNELDNEECLD